MPRLSLTHRQRQVLDFIEDYIRSHRSVAPTHREICEVFGWSSLGTAARKITALVRKGYLVVDRSQVRGISLAPMREKHEVEVVDVNGLVLRVDGVRIVFEPEDAGHGDAMKLAAKVFSFLSGTR